MLITLISGMYTLLHSSASQGLSISQHIAYNRQTYFLMGIILSVVGAAFYGFLLFWLIPAYKLPIATYYVVGVSFVAQLIVAWIPADTSKSAKNTIHTAAGITIGTAMLICIWVTYLFGSFTGALTTNLIPPVAILASVCYGLLLLGLWRYKSLFLPSEVTMILIFSATLIVMGGQW